MEIKINDYAIITIAAFLFALIAIYLFLRSQKTVSGSFSDDFRGINAPGGTYYPPEGKTARMLVSLPLPGVSMQRAQGNVSGRTG